MNADSVYLIAFGGPGKFEEVRPFLENVLRGHPVPPERIETVVEQYRTIGGASPITQITFRQAYALESLLRSKGHLIKVYVGMRNWNPLISETLEEMRREEVRSALAIVLAPHRCEASWGRYQQTVQDAQKKAGYGPPDIHYVQPWHQHPLFIEAVSDCIQKTLRANSISNEIEPHWIFTAHSIPLSMDKLSNYSGQVYETAQLVAKKFGRKKWSVAYQSRSGRPEDPWLEPDVGDKILQLAKEGVKQAVVIPIGFVCDHVEVLYDLDIKAKKNAETAGVEFFRVPAVNDHPQFIEMLADLVLNAQTPG